MKSNAAKVTGESRASDELVVGNTTLVKRIAYHLMSRLPASVQADDLIQAGMIGLIEASRKFDPEQGASFETYAGIRIRGA
ncbi:MAG: sigma-70 family RNA polymerase sigma factor, partial [Zetaproteobacteria bacterium]|nr:sigma-70 family RNA polymerase sigma factor [Zetaproteobacteria bacterium]